MDSLTFDTEYLATALNRVKHAAATQPQRPILCNIVLDGSTGKFRVFAADNYRIAVATIETDDIDATTAFGRALLSIDDVPTVLAFLKTKGDVRVTNAGDSISFAIGPESISFHQMDGTYPNIDAITTKDAPSITVALNPKFLADVGRATKDTPGVNVRTAGLLDVIVVEALDLDYTEWIMPVRTVSA